MTRLWMLLSLTLTTAGQAQQADPLAPFVKFAARQPHDIAVSTWTVRPDGTPDPAKPRLDWNAAQPMPLASSMKIVVLAAYARAVANGELNPDSPVTLAQWEAYDLPGTDGGAHALSLELLGLKADASGRAIDQRWTVRLDDLARMMIEVSDNAATDLLLMRLGKTAVLETARLLGLEQQEDIGPVSGLFAAWNDPTTNAVFLKLSAAQRTQRTWEWAQKVALTPALREPNAMLQASRRTSASLSAQLHNQTAPKGSTQDYAKLMARLLTGAGPTGSDPATRGAAGSALNSALNPKALEIMRRHLGWLTRVSPENAGVYSAVYLKGGSLSGGVLTNNYAFTPKVGPAAGQHLVISLFLRNIPPSEYAALQEHMNDALLMLSILPEQAQRLSNVLNK